MGEDPGEVWAGFIGRYADIRSLAFDGDLEIETDRTYACDLQIFYVRPDSFAFLAEGTLGIDLARGAIIGGSGFWEVPREDFHDTLLAGDLIYFDGEHWIDIELLLRSIFFFRAGTGFQFTRRIGSRYIYSSQAEAYGNILEINRDSLTPVRQLFYGIRDTVRVDYYDWQALSDDKSMPARIRMRYKIAGVTFEYHIKRDKIDPEIQLFYFLPKL